MRRENPSSQNLIFTDDRMYLIDLNDLVYAPKEKDLLYFSGHVHFACFMDGYRPPMSRDETIGGIEGLLRQNVVSWRSDGTM